MNILVTGFPGQDARILASLFRRNHKVFLLMQSGHEGFSKIGNWLIADIRETSKISRYCLENDVEVIVNCAAFSSVQKSWTSPQLCHDVNGLAVENLLNQLQFMRYQGFFYQLGSSDMYGRTRISSIDNPMSPWSPYGQSKKYAFSAVRRAQMNGLRAFNFVLTNHDSNLRPSNFVIKGLAEQVASQIKKSRCIEVSLENPLVTRDWAHALDICRGIELAVNEKIQQDLFFATGVSLSLSGLVTSVCERLGLDLEIHNLQSRNRVVDLQEIYISDVNASKVLGWQCDFLGSDTLLSMIQELTGSRIPFISYIEYP